MTIKEYVDKNFDIEGLREIGLLTNETTHEEVAKRICQWFRFKTIFEYDLIMKEDRIALKADIKTFSTN